MVDKYKKIFFLWQISSFQYVGLALQKYWINCSQQSGKKKCFGFTSSEISNKSSKLKQLSTFLHKENKDIKVLILRSCQPGFFCSGANLKERYSMTNQQIQQLVTDLRSIFFSYYALPFPTISIIDGYALGGGLQIALCTDIRIVTKSAILGLPQTKWGIIPGGGGTQLLQQIIGIAKAKQLIYTARRISGEEAVKINLANYCEQNYDKAYQKALKLIQEMLKNSPTSIRSAKNAIHRNNIELLKGLQIETQNYGYVIASKERMEGFKAFIQKRQPNYNK